MDELNDIASSARSSNRRSRSSRSPSRVYGGIHEISGPRVWGSGEYAHVQGKVSNSRIDDDTAYGTVEVTLLRDSREVDSWTSRLPPERIHTWETSFWVRGKPYSLSARAEIVED